MVVDEARRQIEDLPRGPACAIMLAALCHDLGKPATTGWREGRIRSPGHEDAGVPIATAVLDRLNIQTLDGYDVRAAVLGLVAEHMRPTAFRQSTIPPGDGAFRRLALRVDLELLARFAEADCRGRGGPFDCSASAWFLERARSLGVEHAPPAPLVLGRHILALGVAPGPRVGDILRQLYEKQLDGEIRTLDDGLAVARTLVERTS
jgi:tRNA nucleotidyltransferase (CCA-adding enzyme)